VNDCRPIVKTAFKNWKDRPLAAISKGALTKRYTRLGERSHAQASYALRLLRALFNFASEQYEDNQGHSLFPENPESGSRSVLGPGH